jgi:molecular chaperone DnaK
MVEEAERYAEADRKRRAEVDALNAADGACYQADRLLADFGEKIPPDLRSRIEAAGRETREALSKRDAAAASERAEALKRLLQEAGTSLYGQAGSETPRAGASGAGPEGRVVDAEYRESEKR